MSSRHRWLRTTAWGVVLGVTLAGVSVVPSPASAAVVQARTLQWSECKPEGDDDPEVVKWRAAGSAAADDGDHAVLP
jgi:hypothetical protein